MRIAYKRVSTLDQNTARQLDGIPVDKGETMPQFNETVYCTLSELFNCNGVDGFNDLLEEKLGHGIADASWTVVGLSSEQQITIQVEGDIFPTEDDEIA